MNPPSSSSFPSMKYDVFISTFRGGGDDDKFTCELAEELSNNGLTTFMSNDRFKFGDDSENIVQEAIILNSRYLVVVLTKDYITSIRCLRELSKIMEYRGEDYEEVVIPVFYQHHHPSYLVKELQDFGKRLEDYKVRSKEGRFFKSNCGFLKTKLVARLNKSFSTKRQTDLELNLVRHNPNLFSDQDNSNVLMEVPRWMSALEEITNLPTTIFLTEIRHESDIIKEVKEIINGVKESSKLVGISPQLHQMDNLLDLGSNDICFIGIVGMGGIGKTTIAKALYKNLQPKFSHNHCFLRVSGQKLVSMQNQLLLRLCGKLEEVIKNEDHGAQLIKKCLRNKKVLIVLDGVDEKRQLEKLVRSPDWFNSGSRIIVTTRNRNLCRQPKYKHKIFEYDVEFLDHDSAFSLFCNHAFGEDHEPPDENFRYLAEEIVKKVEGHPSALIKVGSHLYDKHIDKWEKTFKRVHKLLYKDLFHDIMETSYEGLDEDSQQIFLDLACFFHNGMSVDRLIEILESFGYRSSYNKLHLLAERNLIQISNENVHMHTLVRCMGRGIARDERETQSRIWLQKDIRRVFHQEKGLKHVQGIVVMDMEEEELVLEGKSFTNMTELKLLEINNVKINEEIQFLSNKL